MDLKRSRSASPIASPIPASKRAHSQDKESSDTDVSRGASNLTIEPLDTMLDSSASEFDNSSPSPSVPSKPPPLAQLTLITELKKQDLVAGADWALISRVWFRKFATVCSGVAGSKEDDLGLTEEDIGPIDNKVLATEDGKLQMPMAEGTDLELVPKEAYDLLAGWYGELGPRFLRKVIAEAGFGSERVEFYPPTFYLLKLLPSDSNLPVSVPVDHPNPPFVTASASSTIRELKIHMSYIFEMDRDIRLWRIPSGTDSRLDESTKNGPSFMESDKLNLEGTELVENGTIVESNTLSEALLDAFETLIAVEEKSVNGEWLVNAESITPPLLVTDSSFATTVAPATSGGLFGRQFFGSAPAPKVPKRAELTTTTLKSSLSSVFTRSKAPVQKGQRGLTGLQNLGNTCFMNSALQCMSNTRELQEYFTSGAHREELNRDNPLGMGGQVAEAFGQLIERIWSGNGGSVPPREFKQALSKFAPSFSGYGQQDSQELLAFLLDGIHEDLNRIKKKPATNAPDWEGGDDQALVDMARTCWDQYRSRNDSVIVDLFQGQYRSTVVCPDCDKVSITFDPFMYVTTNLPVTKKWTGKVFFVPIDPTKPRYAITLELPKIASIKQMKAAVGTFMNVDPKHLISAEVWTHQFYKAVYDDDSVSDILEKDEIIFFETLAPYPQPKPRTYSKKKTTAASKVEGEEELIIVPVFNYAPKPVSSFKKPFMSGKEDLFGTPMLITLTRAQASTEAGIYRAIVTQYSRVTKLGAEMMKATDDLEAQTARDALGAEESVVVNGTEEKEVKEMSIDGEELDGEMIGDYEIPLITTIDTSDDIVVDLPTPQDEMDLDRSPPTASTSTLPTEEIIPPSPVSTESTLPRRIGPFFTLKVSKKTASEIPLAQNTYIDSTVPLSSRLNRRESSPDSDIFPASSQTTLPGSFISSNLEGKKSADRIEAVEVAPVEAESALPELLASPVPLVSTGDFLVAHWQPPSVDYFYGTAESTWEEVVEFVDPAIEVSKERKLGKKTITIEDCLNEFTKEERLGEDDTWYCPDCKKHQQATKKVEIWKAPDIIVFALKRFSSNRYSRDKLDDFVDFPVEGFNLEEFVEGNKVERRIEVAAAELSGEPLPEAQSLIYDLYAVDNHYGGLGGGHYTAYGKNHETGKWYDFDDSRVSPLSDPNAVKTKAAYLLFYRRRTTTQPLGAKTLELVHSALQSKSNSLANSEAGASRSNSRERSPELDGIDSFRSRAPDYSYSSSFTPRSWSNRSSRQNSDTEADNGDLTPPSAGEEPFFDQAFQYNGDITSNSPRSVWTYDEPDNSRVEMAATEVYLDEPSPGAAAKGLEMMDQVE